MNLLGGHMAAPAAEIDRDLEQMLLGLADGSYVLSTPDGSVAESGVGVVGLLGTPADRLVGQPIADVLIAGADEPARGDFEQLLGAPSVDPSARHTFSSRCAEGAMRSLQFHVVRVPLALGWEFTSLLSELRSRDAGTWHPEELRLRHGRALEAVEGVVRHGTQPDPSARLAGILIVVRDVDAPPLTRQDVDRRMAEQRAAARAAAADAARRLDEAAGRIAPAHEEDASGDTAAGLEDLVERARVLRERVEDAERDGAAATLERDEALARLAATEAERDAATALAAGVDDAEGRVAQLSGERDEARARLEAMSRELDSSRRDAETARTAAATAQAELASARAAAAAAQADVESARAEGQAALAQAESARAEGQAALAQAESARAEGQAALAQAESARAEARAANTAAQAAQAQAQSAQADAQATRAELHALRAHAESIGGGTQSAQADADAARSEAQDARADADAAWAQADGARAEAQAAHTEAESAHADAERLRAELLAMREVVHHERTAHSESADAELSALRAENAAAHTDAEVLRAELGSARAELTVAHGENALARGEASSVRAQLQSHEHDLRGTREQLDATRAELDSARAEVESARAETAAALAAAEDVRAQREDARLRAEQLMGEAEQARAAAEAIRAEFAFEPFAGGGPQDPPVQRTPWSVPSPAAARAPAEATAQAAVPKPDLPAVGPGEAAALIAMDGSFKRLDESFCSLLGCREEDLRAARWPSIIDRENHKAHGELARALKAGEIASAEIETVYMHAQGLLVPIAGTISLHRPPDGGEPYFLFLAEVSRTAGVY